MPSQTKRRDENRGDELFAAALGYAEAGIPVVPLHSINERSACTCGKANCPSPGKHPRWHADDLPKGLKNASIDKTQIEKWWTRWPEANIAGVLGDRYVAIDVDVAEGKGGEESLRDLEGEYGGFPKTAIVKSGEYEGRRGSHFYFTTEASINSKNGFRPGIDIRGHRGYVVLPPSPHSSGVDYEWEVPLSKATAMPEALEEAILDASEGDEDAQPDPDWEPDGTPISAEVRGLLRDGDWPLGEQRSILAKCARALIRSKRGWGDLAEAQGEIVASLLDALERSDQDPEKPWTERDVEKLVANFIENPPEPTRQDRRRQIESSLNDAGNADRFARRFKDEARFVPEWKSWVFWVGDRWKQDAEVLVTQRMLEVARAIPKEANEIGGFGTKETNQLIGQILRWADRSLTAARIKAAVELARAHPDLLARPGDFDSDPDLLNCCNGTLDLRTGDLRPHSRADMLTRQANCDFDPDVVSEDWERVLADAFDGDAEITTYLRRVFGYSLTGNTKEESFFFFHGKPGAGKGTILDSFSGMLGDYASNISARTLTRTAPTSGGAASEDIARLDGMRFVLANEFDPRDDFNAALVSALTGGDKIAARLLYKGTFEFYPRFKIFIAANHLPKQPSSPDSGVWRRIKVVPFDHPVAKIDKDLKARLASPEARSAILAWALRGCLEWRQEGLGAPPERVAEAVEEYREESDPHGTFIEDVLEVSEGNFIPNNLMRDLYQAWAKKNGIRRQLSPKVLTQVLKERGLEQRKRDVRRDGRRTSIKVWEGVRVKGKSDQEQRRHEEARR